MPSVYKGRWYTVTMPDMERSPSFLPSQEASPVQPERQAEAERLVVPEAVVETQVAVPIVAPASSTPAPMQIAANDPRTGVLKQVEGLLSEGLMQLYKSLPESRRAAFKQVGEQVANKITDMIMYGKAKVKEIWKLIGEWLRVVPGVNRYFLEQEIKIKTDRIMMYAESVHA